MKIDGGCHCGFIAYEAEADPAKTAICHCTDCQQLSGSAFRTVVPVADTTFRITAGDPTIYVKTGESGAPRPQAFCPRCGSPIYSTSVGEGPKNYFLRVGSIRQRAQFEPGVQMWSRSRLSWLARLSGVSALETQPKL